MNQQSTAQQDDASESDAHDQNTKVLAMEGQIKDLLQKLQHMTDLAARSQADLQNAKTRMQKDREELQRFSAELTLRMLLPTIDNFQRAAQHLPKDIEGHEWVKGMLATEKELVRQFQELGLQRMECMGTPVDTAMHDVVSVAEGDEGVIVQVLEDGYTLHGRLLRPAKVVVGGGKKG
jgi:molecular chaperone GrpE